MRILHILPSIDPASGGPVEGLRQICSIYRMGGHEVEVASMDPPELVSKLEFPVTAFGLGSGERSGNGRYGYSPRAVPWLKTNLARFDLVVINAIWQYNAVAAYRALAGSGIPYAVFTHGMLDPYFKQRFPLKHLKKVVYWHLFLRRMLRDARGVMFTCEEEKLLARQSFRPYQVREQVIPYGTFGPDCELSEASEEFMTRWPQLRGKRLAITMGRIHPKKATDVLIEAFAATLARDPAWQLVIAGPDQVGWRKELEVIAERLGIGDRITWTGMLKGSRKWGAFAAAEVFVLPSHQENFGIVVAEALACGLPVILSKRVNIWREIENCGAGVIDEDTVEGTVASLRHWVELTSAEIAGMRVQAKQCFEANFNFERTSKRVLEIIEGMAVRGRDAEQELK